MPDTPSVKEEKHEFKAEVAALLRLVTRSLYTSREIFIRELISNASDAIDKARFQALIHKDLGGQDLDAQITITLDKQRNMMVFEDTGIGMTADELGQNLGTIAHSGTLKFLEEAASREAEGQKPDLDLIGQFGVGFYSAFMVADRIEVTTRSGLPDADAATWSSAGDGGYSIAAATRETRGTRIELHLKEDAKEFLERYRVETVIRRFSNFVLHPIVVQVIDDKGEKDGEAQKVNEASAFWTRSPKELEESDYEEFYKHVMGGFVLPGDKPLGHLHLSLDAPMQFKAVLYIPGRRPPDLFAEDSKHLQLFARRVLVMENCDKLLPVYLRFMRGVVDSEDLPLNVSREMLQEHQALAAIRRQLTRKVLKLLADTAKDDKETYEKIWTDFGVFIKEGLHIDNAHREQITDLLRFSSHREKTELVSLREYVDAMPEGQDAIYYITGQSAEDLGHSPHLEACRARGYAVLLMTDTVDEWVVQDLKEFDGKPLRSVTQGDLSLPNKQDDADADSDDDAAKGGSISELIEQTKTVLGERVTDVRASKRLTESASCLVDAEGSMGRNMERIMQMVGRDVQSRARVLELNPDHMFVKAANKLAKDAPKDGQLNTYIELLFDQANLAEGQVPDPAGMVKRIQSVLNSTIE